MNCFRFFGFKSLDEVNCLSFEEYELLIRAENLKQVDRDYRVHQLAWLPIMAKSEKKVGKNKTRLVYNRFEKFYNYKDALEKAGDPGSRKNECKYKGYDRYLRERRNV